MFQQAQEDKLKLKYEVDLSKIYLYRMTHIQNVPHILTHGITHRTSANANSNFIPIGDPTLITKRNDFKLNNGRTLGEYIPFYFEVRMPMLYGIQNGYNGITSLDPKHIVYCVSSVEKVLNTELEFVFTNGHAVHSFSGQYSIDDIQRMEDILDMKAIQTKYWNDKNDLDLKRRKQAEFLVLGDLPFETILKFIVYDELAFSTLKHFGIIESAIHINKNAYF